MGHTKQELKDLQPTQSFFVGVDSDGCVFDTMEVKQKQCFHPEIISHWHFESIEKELREAAEFVNLYSKWRGQNRFLSLVRVMDLLRVRPEVIAAKIAIPEFPELARMVDAGIPLGNPTLESEIERTGSEELVSLLKWSEAVNASIAETAKNIPPFENVRESLDLLKKSADIIVVSQTPLEALVREWEEHEMEGYVHLIAGQELGTKTEHLQMGSGGKYTADNVMMIGDAPGDLQAARDNDAKFYPILPGREDYSWERFCDEAGPRFLAGEYDKDYESKLIDEFNALLPATPPWQN